MIGCKKCGACCKVVVMVISTKGIIGLDDQEWAKYHNLKLLKRGNLVLVFIPCRCNHLKEDNSCDIYFQRPQTCVVFPNMETADLIPEGCKYFEN